MIHKLVLKLYKNILKTLPNLFMFLFAISNISASEILEKYLSEAQKGIHLSLNDEKLYSTVLIKDFYAEKKYEIVWVKNNNLEKPLKMLNVINMMEHEGLNPLDYHLNSISKLLQNIEDEDFSNEENLVALDIFLTDAFFMISSHLHLGKINPETLKTEWNIRRNRAEIDFKYQLESALKTSKISTIINSIAPQDISYQLLKEELRQKKRLLIGEGWKSIKIKESIKPLVQHDNIPTLRKRVYNLNNVFINLESITDSTFYDSTMVELVKNIQLIHGLNADGVIGQNTIDALNMDIADRIKIIAVNLERHRWLPHNIENEHIWVNIADFKLNYIKDKDTVANLRVVVGKDYRKTPVFYAKMNHLVFSPTWTVPPTIFRNDILPALRQNANYLNEKNMIVIDRNGNKINSSKINWNEVTASNFPYMIRQQPGKDNALGGVKFMFPNTYHVYIHDTPSKNLFTREIRNFSSGCIRVEKPDELAMKILADDKNWSIDKVRNAMFTGKEKRVNLTNHIPVYITYFTAWANNRGINFRKDIYQRDDEIAKALMNLPVF